MEDFFCGVTAPRRSGLLHYQGFTITLGDTIHGRTPLDEWSARHRDLYLTTHNILERQDFHAPAGLEPTIPASDWPQTHAFDREAAGRVEYWYLVARQIFYFYYRDVSPCRSSTVVRRFIWRVSYAGTDSVSINFVGYNLKIFAQSLRL